jgi:hypothetical protein
VKVTIRKVGLGSVARFGCWLGLVAAFLPSLLLGVGGVALARLVYRWLLSWQSIQIAILGRDVAHLDLVYGMGLARLLDTLRVVITASLPLSILAIAALSLAGGALLAAIAVLAGLAYNLLARLSGGLEVELEAVTGRGQDT